MLSEAIAALLAAGLDRGHVEALVDAELEGKVPAGRARHRAPRRPAALGRAPLPVAG
jgi:hypothetical protein